MQVVRTVAKQIESVENNRQNRRDWLDEHKLKHALFDSSVEHSAQNKAGVSMLDWANKWRLTYPFAAV